MVGRHVCRFYRTWSATMFEKVIKDARTDNLEDKTISFFFSSTETIESFCNKIKKLVLP